MTGTGFEFGIDIITQLSGDGGKVAMNANSDVPRLPEHIVKFIVVGIVAHGFPAGHPVSPLGSFLIIHPDELLDLSIGDEGSDPLSVKILERAHALRKQPTRNFRGPEVSNLFLEDGSVPWNVIATGSRPGTVGPRGQVWQRLYSARSSRVRPS